MKICGNCQNEVPGTAASCPRCGAELPRGFFGGLVNFVFGKRPAKTESSPAPSPSPPTPSAPRTAGEPFEFEVEDVFTITGRGTVATGRVARGRIAVGDEVAFVSPKGERVQRRIAAVEAFQKVVTEAREGETVGLLLAKPVPLNALVRGVRLERA